MSLTIKDLRTRVQINSKEYKSVLNGVNFTIKSNEIHAIMGPNGSGKSSFANALAHHPDYEITSGKIILDGNDITKSNPDEIAKLGLFLSFQHPPEIEGVGVSNFLRVAKGAINRKKPNIKQWVKDFSNFQENLKIDKEFTGRSLNVGFSGGEKKKNEILQLMLLKPKYAILDEIDSGLDVDALKIVANNVNKIKKDMGLIIITHYARILEHIKPDFVHIFAKGKIVKSGKSDLAKKLEYEGYDKYL
ncbi:MAG: Fe-S cluster assembly ATPase SufC [Bifidobacteriaceae bacterium]|jgi:Fe-S cluster assembly ATP-binding protein|nr:Fe-S cluster assembly ATPase SufC [Bifidobacteriaceae bacterium]